MRYILKKYWLFLVILLPLACQEEYELGDTPPVEADAAFTMTTAEDSDNKIIFSSGSDSFLKIWDLGNGQTGKGNTITGIYPDSGTYVINLTVYNAAGSISSTQEIYIAMPDPTLLDKPLYNFLTGGADAENGKVWVMDSTSKSHFGVGPNPVDEAAGYFPNYYDAGALEKSGGGMYDDTYTFKLAAYGFEMETNGNVYINPAQSGEFSETYESPVGDLTANYNAPENLTWNIVEAGEFPILTISNGGFLGYYTGVSTYQIISISENQMFLRYLDSSTPDLSWYIKLIQAGYDAGGGEGGGEEEPETYSLPLTFETEVPTFDVFGGSTYEVVDNPDASGINTSAKVATTTHGGETWAGLFVSLTDPLDFSSLNTFKIKVWAPQTGTFRLKFENAANGDDFVEIDQDITVVEEWQELSFDVSAVTSDQYSKIVIFPGWNVSNAGTFYFDDMQLVSDNCDGETGESLEPDPGINFNLQSDVSFGQFGNIVAGRVPNPNPSGINTSCFVNSYEKSAGCETWSGVAYGLDNAIDFASTTKKVFKMKVFAVDQVTDVVLRLEKLPHPDTEPSAERIATISGTGAWEELTFDFSDITDPNTYKNLVIYFERGATCDGDSYYFDDLVQVEAD
ncbi:PKD domain-containing protein [Fulvivirga ligni]|uniref:PKD domain-containing protein n=1 Tax=Fulvivirga ligni TaxID=2904246 RepID=UPI001F2A2077|nr:PKD domain-containing protein [Fulvivirga ligni]UII23861.1 PKD domain-containing protein [Fulvivirga ligni]